MPHPLRHIVVAPVLRHRTIHRSPKLTVPRQLARQRLRRANAPQWRIVRPNRVLLSSMSVVLLLMQSSSMYTGPLGETSWRVIATQQNGANRQKHVPGQREVAEMKRLAVHTQRRIRAEPT